MSTAEMAQAAMPGRPTLRTAATIAAQALPTSSTARPMIAGREQVVHHAFSRRGTVAEAQPTLAGVGDGLHQQHRRRIPGDGPVGFRTVRWDAIHARLETARALRRRLAGRHRSASDQLADPVADGRQRDLAAVRLAVE